MRFFRGYGPPVIWGSIFILLFVVWADSAFAVDRWNAGYLLAICLASLLVLFLSSGIEIAFTDLRDKDPDQVSKSIRATLFDMKHHEALVYEAREWLTVICVVVLTASSDFAVLCYPWLLHWTRIENHSSTGRLWTLAFSIIFTTLPAVWFAQAPAKHLASRNSEQFLQRFGKFWLVLKVAGSIAEKLGLNALSRSVAEFWVQEGRLLRPSRKAFYMNSLKRYGYSLHRISDEFLMKQDGTSEIIQKGIFCVLSDERTEFERKFFFDTPILDCQFILTAAYIVPPPRETFDELEELVTALSAGNIPPLCEELKVNRFRITHDLGDKPQKEVTVTIETPFALKTRQEPAAIVVKYEAKVIAADGSWPREGGPDYRMMIIKFPYGVYTCKVSAETGSGVSVAQPRVEVFFEGVRHEDEERDVLVDEAGEGVAYKIAQPLPGAVYKLNWQVWEN